MNLIKTDLQKKKLQACKQDDVWDTPIHLQYSLTNNGWKSWKKNSDMHKLKKSTINSKAQHTRADLCFFY